MLRDLTSRIEDYTEKVTVLPRYEDHYEIIEVFIRRELIEDELGQHTISPALEQQLREADALLIKRRLLLMRRFSEVFALRAADIPRRYWWWYLDEGPQVQEQARSA